MLYFYYMKNGKKIQKEMKDLAEYFLNLRPAKTHQSMESGEIRCAWFQGGLDAGSIFLIQEEADFQAVEIHAAENDAQILWQAGILTDEIIAELRIRGDNE